jgi:hypothetical protein
MPGAKLDTDSIDWSLTTWEGSRREQLRRWAELSLREIIQAQEEMRELSERFAQTQDSRASSGKKT